MYRVLHLIKSLGRGGAETLLSETLRVHDRGQFDFHYAYFVSYKGQMGEDLRQQGAPVHCLEVDTSAAILARLPALLRHVREGRFDLIHCHLPVSAVVGRLVGRLIGVPVVYTEHNKQERYHPITRRVNLATMGLNAAILSVSEDVKQSIEARWNGDRRKLRVLINGVNTQRFNPADYDKTRCRSELGLPAGVPIIGTVCVFRTQKRLDRWMQLARDLKQQIPEAYFVVLGDGPMEEQVKQLAITYQLKDSIVFPGRLEEVRPYLAAMDIYLMTSEFEGLPIAMLEAMSMALPVVATAAGGIGEAIRSGEEGLVEPVGEWFNLLPHLLQLVQNEQLRQQLGTAARRRVLAEFSIRKMAKELEAVYTEVLTQSKLAQA